MEPLLACPTSAASTLSVLAIPVVRVGDVDLTVLVDREDGERVGRVLIGFAESGTGVGDGARKIGDAGVVVDQLVDKLSGDGRRSFLARGHGLGGT